MLENLTELALAWGFPVLLVVLMSSGFGVPIPEDIPLLLTGFLCDRKGLPVWEYALFCYVAVITRDTFVFTLGKRLPERWLEKPLLRRILPPKRRKQVEGWFREKGWRMAFAGRFMPGIRVLVFFVAGRSGLTYRTFLLADGIAGLISIPVLVVLGYFFSHQLPAIQERVHGIQTIVLVVLVLYFAQSILRGWLRMRRRKRLEAEQRASGEVVEE